MKLFQYWDTGSPPDEVAGWIEGFRVKNPELKHRLFDRDSASWFIRKHLGERYQRAFDACAVPSMQSDYIRICAVEVMGGVYADADLQCLQPLNGFIERAPRSLMLSWGKQLLHSFMMMREAHDPLISASLELVTRNIEERRFTSAYTATGPAILNAIRGLVYPGSLEKIFPILDNPVCRSWDFPGLVEFSREVVSVTPELQQSLADLTVIRSVDALPWIGTEQPAYKETDAHWLTWNGPIYRDVAL